MIGEKFEGIVPGPIAPVPPHAARDTLPLSRDVAGIALVIVDTASAVLCEVLEPAIRVKLANVLPGESAIQVGGNLEPRDRDFSNIGIARQDHNAVQMGDPPPLPFCQPEYPEDSEPMTTAE